MLKVGVVQPCAALLFLGVLIFRALRKFQKYARESPRPLVGRGRFGKLCQRAFRLCVRFFQRLVLVVQPAELVGNSARRRWDRLASARQNILQ